MLRYIIVISMVISVCFASGTYRRCADGRGDLPLNVFVKSGKTLCTQSPCAVKPLTELRVIVGFTSTTDTRTLTPILRFYVGNISGVYELPEERQNGCNWLIGALCPVVKREDVIYDLGITVPDVDEKLIISLEFSLLNDNQDPQFCFIVDVKMVN